MASVLILAAFLSSLRWTMIVGRSGSPQGHLHTSWMQTGPGSFLFVSATAVDSGGQLYPGERKIRWSFTVQRQPPIRMIWWPTVYIKDSDFSLFLPMWIPWFVFTVPTAFLFYRDRAVARRRVEGKCLACGYDLRGLTPNTPCPECGRAVATRTGEAR